jgi:hypothetical protein
MHSEENAFNEFPDCCIIGFIIIIIRSSAFF